MNVSQEIRNTLTRSGDRMSVAEITDAIGGLADKGFVQAICSQQFKKKVFGRAMEDGRMVYWMANPDAATSAEDPPAEEQGAAGVEAVHVEPPAPVAVSAKVEEVKPSAAVVADRPTRTKQAPRERPIATESTSTTKRLDDLVKVVQTERFARMERTSNNLSRLLSTLLSDAIDARLEHEVLSRLSAAQLAVQDVHGFLAQQA